MSKVLAVACAAAALCAGLAVSAYAGNGTPINTGSADSLTLAVYGDAPYGTTPTDTAEFEATPAFIQSINNDPKVRLVMHVGDIHSGKQFCTQSYDQSVFELWKSYDDPVVYTPGDNEWSDCHKATAGPNGPVLGEGGGLYNKNTGQIDYVKDADGNPVDYANGNPAANLALVRSIFFPTPGLTLGGRKKQVISQAQVPNPAHPADQKFVENVMWEQSKTLFVTLNLPGGSNDDTDIWYKTPAASPEQLQERAERDQADLDWIDAAFAQARADGVGAVVIGEQADMWDVADTPTHQSNYEPFVREIANQTSAFGKPVLLFNGDSHLYRSDNPLVQGAPCDGEAGAGCDTDAYSHHPGYDVPNFHRVTVHGSTFPLEWLKLTIDPETTNPTTSTSFGPFSWERIQP
jgi:hypothetical protein